MGNLVRHRSTLYNSVDASDDVTSTSIAMNTHSPHVQPPSQSGRIQPTATYQQRQHPPQKYHPTSLHPSLVDKLDPSFVKLHNEYLAASPPPSTDINVVRSNYSVLYSYATAPPTGVGGIGETTVPGWAKYPGEISVRVYVPPGEEPGKRKVWPVHFNFHGGGKHAPSTPSHGEKIC